MANGELVGTEVPELGLLSPVHLKPTDRRADGARRKFTHTHRALSPRAWVTGAARAAPSWGRACRPRPPVLLIPGGGSQGWESGWG